MSDDFSQRAARGQAYNLAVATAIADGRQHDNEYITRQFLRHMAFASLLQKADPHQLASILDTSPEVMRLIQELDGLLNEL